MILINALICAAITLRIVFALHGEQYRQRISLIAYLLAVSAGTQTLISLMGMVEYISFNQVVINAVLLSALLCQRGNIANIFKNRQQKSRLSGVLLASKCDKKRRNTA